MHAALRIALPLALLTSSVLAQSITPGANLQEAIVRSRRAPDHTVQLAAGTYRLTSPLQLTVADSGLTLRGTNAILSGGVPLKGWHSVVGKPGLWQTRLPAGAPLPRQIYVDGVRATRTRGRVPVVLTMTKTGFTASADTLAHWLHPGHIEFVWTGGNAVWSETSVGVGSWTEVRCPLASASGTIIAMAEPCWTNSTARVMLPNGKRTANLIGPAGVGKEPSYVENAFELLGRPGEFYADSASRQIFYTPRTGEDLRSADVELPVLERLLNITGTAAAPAENITVAGITFSYAGWQFPNTPEGFSEMQANYNVTGKDGATKQGLCTFSPGGACPFADYTPEPGNVQARFIDHVSFLRDTFTHLGAAGLSITEGAHDNLVEGCTFTDISGNGLELAGVNKPMAPDAEYAIHNRIENNLFRNTGAEFRGAIGLITGYARLTHIAHNRFDQLPYAAISIGWGGWPDKIQQPGVANRSTGNVIEANRIDRFMLILSDGGGIYTQGRTGETLAEGERVERNVITDQFSTGHGIYTDNGSAMITVRSNVIFHTNHDNWGSRHADYYDGATGTNDDPLAILGNWWEQGDGDSDSRQVAVKGNHLIHSLTEAPKKLLDDAGLEAPFRDLLTSTARPVAPEPPSGIGVYVAQDAAYVTWHPSVFNGNARVSSYQVSSNDGLTTTVSAADFDRLGYLRVPTATTRVRTFTVQAVNAAGASAPSLTSAPVAISPSEKPAAPSSVKAYVQGTRASIHIGAPKSNAEHVLSYTVTIQPGGRMETFTGRKLLTLEGRHVTFVTLDGLDETTAYRFAVQAVNSSGASEPAVADGIRSPAGKDMTLRYDQDSN
jgi:hypothetical protein